MSGSQKPKKADSQHEAGTRRLEARKLGAMWTQLGQAFGRAGRLVNAAAGRFWQSSQMRWTAAGTVLLVVLGVGFAFGRWSVAPRLEPWGKTPPVAMKAPTKESDQSALKREKPNQPAPKVPVEPPKADGTPEKTQNGIDSPAAGVGSPAPASSPTPTSSKSGKGSDAVKTGGVSSANTGATVSQPRQQPAAVAASGGLATATGVAGTTGAIGTAEDGVLSDNVTGTSATVSEATTSLVPPQVLVWPASGTVTRTYGWQKSEFGDWRLSPNMTISGTPGRAVYAVLDGQVNQVLPNGVILKHANGWVSHYSLLNLVTVSQGQQVTQGTIIGRAAGDLDFALFHGTAAVNPSLYLP